MSIGVGAYKDAYVIGLEALKDPENDHDEIVAVLCDLTARLRSECMDRAVCKSDYGEEYDALEDLLSKANRLTGQDMYGSFKD
jgi:hypothetical protein